MHNPVHAEGAPLTSMTIAKTLTSYYFHVLSPSSPSLTLGEKVIASGELTEDMRPTDNQYIVRHLIDKQKFDGSWNLDSKSIEQLTGKSLTVFPQSKSNQVLVSAIFIAVLETLCALFPTMWYGVV